ncbi:MAG: hypothetical protein C0427_10320 [Rhodobacter sp.]|nr:hypothetical protein [Rhodobacter sp.]
MVCATLRKSRHGAMHRPAGKAQEETAMVATSGLEGVRAVKRGRRGAGLAFGVCLGVGVVAGCTPVIDGAWRITAECPPQSHFGAITIEAQAEVEEVGRGQYVGSVTNNLGERGQFAAQMERSNLRVQTNWDRQLPTETLLVADAGGRSFQGMDSNGCDLTVVRP